MKQMLFPASKVAALALACWRGVGEFASLQTWRLRDHLVHQTEKRESR